MDDLFHSEDEECEIVRDLIIEGIKTGVVKPLPSTVHEVSDMKSSTGVSPYRKHEGKALLRIDHDKSDTVEVIETGTHSLTLNLDSEKSYVIIGGLGDWGLELADWLIERGATKIVLNSEVTVFNAYQGLCLRRWSRNKDVIVKVTTFHISNPKMVEDLVLEARKLGPVGGVFSVSPIQKVTSTLNNAERSFQEVFKTEVECAQNLDTVTRNHCPDLDHFLLISLSTCGRESFGQKVYGMLGSILDRLCEKRKHDKFPGLSIQWGAVDVHVSTESESKIAPAKWIPQHVTACLNAIEKFIGKKSSVGSSLLVSELE